MFCRKLPENILKEETVSFTLASKPAIVYHGSCDAYVDFPCTVHSPDVICSSASNA
jgi:hypothetical protein